MTMYTQPIAESIRRRAYYNGVNAIVTDHSIECT